jgi:hypothetical protein
VLAAGAGVVGWAGILAGRGVVSVRHAGGLRTTYEPVTPTVRVGQAVASGARLGVLVAGHPGCPRQACLHWGLLQGDEYLDPLRLLGFGPVRLLPLSGSPAPRAGVNGVGAAGPAPAGSATPPAFHRPLMLPSTTAATAGVAVLLWMLTNRRRPP